MRFKSSSDFAFASFIILERSSSYSANFFLPVVRLAAIEQRAAPTAPTRALAPPPPGVGADDESSPINPLSVFSFIFIFISIVLHATPLFLLTHHIITIFYPSSMLFSFHPIIARKSVFRIIKSLVKLYCHVFIILKKFKTAFFNNTA